MRVKGIKQRDTNYDDTYDRDSPAFLKSSDGARSRTDDDDPKSVALIEQGRYHTKTKKSPSKHIEPPNQRPKRAPEKGLGEARRRKAVRGLIASGAAPNPFEVLNQLPKSASNSREASPTRSAYREDQEHEVEEDSHGEGPSPREEGTPLRGEVQTSPTISVSSSSSSPQSSLREVSNPCELSIPDPEDPIVRSSALSNDSPNALCIYPDGALPGEDFTQARSSEEPLLASDSEQPAEALEGDFELPSCPPPEPTELSPPVPPSSEEDYIGDEVPDEHAGSVYSSDLVEGSYPHSNERLEEFDEASRALDTSDIDSQFERGIDRQPEEDLQTTEQAYASETLEHHLQPEYDTAAEQDAIGSSPPQAFVGSDYQPSSEHISPDQDHREYTDPDQISSPAVQDSGSYDQARYDLDPPSPDYLASPAQPGNAEPSFDNQDYPPEEDTPQTIPQDDGVFLDQSSPGYPASPAQPSDAEPSFDSQDYPLEEDVPQTVPQYDEGFIESGSPQLSPAPAPEADYEYESPPPNEFGAERSFSPGYADEPAPVQYEEPASPYLEEQTPPQFEEQLHPHFAEESPAHFEEGSPLQFEEQAPPHLEEQPPLHFEEQPPLHYEDESSPHLEEQPASPYFEEQPPPHVEEQPPLHFEEQLPPHSDEQSSLLPEEQLRADDLESVRDLESEPSVSSPEQTPTPYEDPSPDQYTEAVDDRSSSPVQNGDFHPTQDDFVEDPCDPVPSPVGDTHRSIYQEDQVYPAVETPPSDYPPTPYTEDQNYTTGEASPQDPDPLQSDCPPTTYTEDQIYLAAGAPPQDSDTFQSDYSEDQISPVVDTSFQDSGPSQSSRPPTPYTESQQFPPGGQDRQVFADDSDLHTESESVPEGSHADQIDTIPSSPVPEQFSPGIEQDQPPFTPVAFTEQSAQSGHYTPTQVYPDPGQSEYTSEGFETQELYGADRGRSASVSSPASHHSFARPAESPIQQVRFLEEEAQPVEFIGQTPATRSHSFIPVTPRPDSRTTSRESLLLYNPPPQSPWESHSVPGESSRTIPNFDSSSPPQEAPLSQASPAFPAEDVTMSRQASTASDWTSRPVYDDVVDSTSLASSDTQPSPSGLSQEYSSQAFQGAEGRASEVPEADVLEAQRIFTPSQQDQHNFPASSSSSSEEIETYTSTHTSPNLRATGVTMSAPPQTPEPSTAQVADAGVESPRPDVATPLAGDRGPYSAGASAESARDMTTTPSTAFSTPRPTGLQISTAFVPGGPATTSATTVNTTTTSYFSSGIQTERRPGKLVHRTNRFVAWVKRNRVVLLWFFVYTFGLVGCTINAYIMTGWLAKLSLIGQVVVGFACASFPLEPICAFLISMQWDTYAPWRFTLITCLEGLIMFINVGLTTGQLVHYHSFGDYEFRFAQRPANGKAPEDPVKFLEGPELRAFQAAWSWGLVSTALVTAVSLPLFVASVLTCYKARKEKKENGKATGSAASMTGSYASSGTQSV